MTVAGQGRQHPALSEALRRYDRGEFAKAEKLCRPLLKTNPTNAPLLQFVAILYNRQGKFEKAEALLAKAVRLAPDSAETHFNRGANFIDLEAYQEAVASLERVLILKPGYPDTHSNLALALFKAERVADAEKHVHLALSLKPHCPEALSTKGAILLYEERFAEAEAFFRKSLELGCRYPAAALESLGWALLRLNRISEAIDSLETALKVGSKSAHTHMLLAEAYAEQDRFAEAIKRVEAALGIDPNNADAAFLLVKYKRASWDWRHLGRCERRALDLLRDATTLIAAPFIILSMRDEPALHLDVARTCAAGISNKVRGRMPERQRVARDKIRVGYLSADFHTHATAILMAGLFDLHDHKRFETYAFSYGPEEDSEMRRRLFSAFDKFLDVRNATPEQTANLVRELEIDIAVDLKGYTWANRNWVLASRPAPIQATHIGYPGTLGAHWIDYAIVDPFVIPEDQRKHHTEKLVYLPECYQANDVKRALPGRAPHRSDLGLPEHAFVFCCFNTNYKVTPQMFDVWARLLEAVPDSVLWLYSAREPANANLRREADSRGMDLRRLIFAPKVSPPTEHVRRQQCADLFLDTFPYNAHTTASDALWAGLPVVTCAGESFASRVAGSLLHTIGLPELVTRSLTDYEALAIKLATDSTLYASIRAKLQRNRATSPLFDTARFARHIEAAYEQMWTRWLQGEPPESFSVPLLS